MHEPSYMALYESGELKARLEALESKLASCTICPRTCKVNRLNNEHGFCLSGYKPYITSICDHHGEEPVLSGTNGSGTVFFGSCNLRCVYCQNWQISQKRNFYQSAEMDFSEAARQIVRLQDERGVHNINFVSPAHFVPQMVRIIYEAIPLGLRLPIVYNTNAYDALSSLRLLEGIVDIYLPDFKYFDDRNGVKYSRAPGYSIHAKAAIREMYRQVGTLQLNDEGLAVRGLLIRHLILPNDLSDSADVLRWIADTLGADTAVSLMAQYFPTHKAKDTPLLDREIRYSEYVNAVEALEKTGLNKGFVQDMSAPEIYRPDFYSQGHPFEKDSGEL